MNIRIHLYNYLLNFFLILDLGLPVTSSLCFGKVTSYLGMILTLRIIVVLFHSGEQGRGLSWEERVQIILDISHGIEYLHEGVYAVI